MCAVARAERVVQSAVLRLRWLRERKRERERERELTMHSVCDDAYDHNASILISISALRSRHQTCPPRRASATLTISTLTRREPPGHTCTHAASSSPPPTSCGAHFDVIAVSTSTAVPHPCALHFFTIQACMQLGVFLLPLRVLVGKFGKNKFIAWHANWGAIVGKDHSLNPKPLPLNPKPIL